MINAEFGRPEYFSNVLLSDDLKEIAEHFERFWQVRVAVFEN